MQVVVRFLPHEKKKCDCLKNAFSKVAGVTNLVIGETEARMTYRGDWDDLCLIEYAAWRLRAKASLVDPAQFVIDFSIGRENSPRKLLDELGRLPGVLKVYMEDGKAYVIGAVSAVDARLFAPLVRKHGFNFLRLESHRLRTLSYEAWSASSSPQKLREALLRNPAVLRVDLDEREKTVTVLLIPYTTKDLGLVAAGEEAEFTIFPGKAGDEEPPAAEPTPAPSGK
jgi:hypothetical protein